LAVGFLAAASKGTQPGRKYDDGWGLWGLEIAETPGRSAIMTAMEIDSYWRTRTIAEAQEPAIGVTRQRDAQGHWLRRQ